ncbi:MAG: DEAD/DEAH box helicase, partial [Pseudomonadota bacterium]
RSRKSDKPVVEETAKEPVEAVKAYAPTAQETPKPEKPSRTRRGRDRDGSPKTVGMGDHMPSFIAMSFDERKAG